MNIREVDCKVRSEDRSEARAFERLIAISPKEERVQQACRVLLLHEYSRCLDEAIKNKKFEVIEGNPTIEPLFLHLTFISLFDYLQSGNQRRVRDALYVIKDYIDLHDESTLEQLLLLSEPTLANIMAPLNQESEKTIAITLRVIWAVSQKSQAIKSRLFDFYVISELQMLFLSCSEKLRDYQPVLDMFCQEDIDTYESMLRLNCNSESRQHVDACLADDDRIQHLVKLGLVCHLLTLLSEDDLKLSGWAVKNLVVIARKNNDFAKLIAKYIRGLEISPMESPVDKLELFCEVLKVDLNKADALSFWWTTDRLRKLMPTTHNFFDISSCYFEYCLLKKDLGKYLAKLVDKFLAFADNYLESRIQRLVFLVNHNWHDIEKCSDLLVNVLSALCSILASKRDFCITVLFYYGMIQKIFGLDRPVVQALKNAILEEALVSLNSEDLPVGYKIICHSSILQMKSKVGDLKSFDVLPPADNSSYHALEELGKGCFGVVSLCRAAGSQVTYARKSAIGERRDKAEQGLCNEIALLTLLSHENIVGYMGYSINANKNNSPELLLEYCEAGSLAYFLACWPSLHLNGQASLALGIARAVTFFHENDLVVCDIKPENILLTDASCETSSVKLADFGLVKAPGWGGVCGTHQFFSPELFGSQFAVVNCLKTNTTASDIWAMGMVFAELAGKRVSEDFFHKRKKASIQKVGLAYHLNGRHSSIDFVRITNSCLSFCAESRPTACEAVQGLEKLSPGM